MNETINSNDIRINNTRKILYALRNSPPITKKELADHLNLSLPTIASITKELEEKGYLLDRGSAASSVGRKPSLVSLNSEACFTAGVHIATHALEIAVVNFGGAVLSRKVLRIPFSGTETYWRDVSKEVDRMIGETGINKTLVQGIRFTVPYILYPQYWTNTNLKSKPRNMIPLEEVTSFFSYDTDRIEEADAAGVPSYWYGELNRDAAVIYLGRYIEGCILRKDPITGIVSAKPCQLGHISLNYRGRDCFCGKKGCFQEYCSISHIVDKINGLNTSRDVIGRSPRKKIIHMNEFIQLMEEGNGEYRALFDEYLTRLAYAIHNIRLLVNCDIVICGEISELLARYKPMLAEKISSININSWDDANDYLHTSSLGRYDACIGAALGRIDSLVESLS